MVTEKRGSPERRAPTCHEKRSREPKTSTKLSPEMKVSALSDVNIEDSQTEIGVIRSARPRTPPLKYAIHQSKNSADAAANTAPDVLAAATIAVPMPRSSFGSVSAANVVVAPASRAKQNLKAPELVADDI